MAALRIATLALVLAGVASAQVNQRVSLDKSGAQADGDSIMTAISGDGRYIAFMSWATNLVPGDTNGVSDIFVRDRLLGSTERVSVSSTGEQANAFSQRVAISADGRFVAFWCGATNLVPNASSGGDIYVRDLVNHTTEIASVNSAGVAGNFGSDLPSISGDGRFVAFASDSTNLVPGHHINDPTEFFVHDRMAGTTECVSNIAGGGTYNDKWPVDVKISEDGRFVAFQSYATNLDPSINDGHPHIYVRDRLTHAIVCASIAPDGHPGSTADEQPAISANGRFVVFANWDPGDLGGTPRLYVRDIIRGVTERICVSSQGEVGNRGGYLPAISADGRYVAFESDSTNLVPSDTNRSADIFLRDRVAETTERVNLEPNGEQATYGGGGFFTSISSDGRFVAFDNYASDLVWGDTNERVDVFVRDRAHPPFKGLCDPGSLFILNCPCGNPPSSRSRGCDNASHSGGASLTAAGGEYLSSDTLFFRTSGEPPRALSVVLQGTDLLAGGAAFGHGVRCLGGTMKRLYTRVAFDGGMTVPEFGASEPSVHQRSASLGDVIQAVSTRWYAVVYRDPITLAACPAAIALNTTVTREVLWLP